MKSYEHVVVWLDYFNKNLKRSRGRKMGLDRCVFDPSLKELMDAAKSAGFEITEHNEKARFPRKPYVRSGYVVVPRQSAKTVILDKIAKKMVAKRAKHSK